MSVLRASLLALCARAAVGAPPPERCNLPDTAPVAASALLELRRLGAAGPAATATWSGSPREACTELVNQGTFFTVDVEVGTPGQRFSVVADTGSNTLIVPSCICQYDGYCSEENNCFTGTNRSSTFALITPKGMSGPATMLITFGSGTIQGLLAKETVRIGGLEVDMKAGIMLMTSKALDFGGPFEGILGLGMPKAFNTGLEGQGGQGERAGGRTSASASEEASWDRMVKQIRKIFGGAQISADTPGMGQAHEAEYKLLRQPPGVLEQAHIGRFAMCFNEGSNGILRLGPSEALGATPHASVGKDHWALDFRGISVAGNELEHMEFCSPEGMAEGQETPCGAIPDSGTTMITAPRKHLAALLSSICDHWPRCKENHTAFVKAAEAAASAAMEQYGFNPFHLEVRSKVEVLEALLEDCEAWVDESLGLGELPALHFHVAGGSNTSQTLALPGRAYVMETSLANQRSLSSDVEGKPGQTNLTKDVLEVTGGHRKVCSPAFSVMDYDTVKNGPVWILGTPFFYEFNVGYDLLAEPPTISFQSVAQVPCGSCSKEASLASSDASVTTGSAASARLRRPRWVTGPARRPSFEVGQPL